MLGSTFAPSAIGQAADLEFDRCPCADLAAPWIARVMRLWRVADGRVEGLAAALGSAPSDTGLILWDVLGGAIGELRAELARRARDRRKRGSGHD